MKNKGYFLFILFAFLIITVSILFFVGPELIQQRLDNLPNKNKGEVGDAFGGTLGPVIAWIASILTFAAFYVQYKANIQQSESIKMQRFEDTFFRLLENHQRMIEMTDLKGREHFGDNSIVGRDCFKHIYTTLTTRIWSDNVQDKSIGNVLIYYDKLQNEYKSDLHHYFRFIYHILKFIKYSEINETEKYKYTSILRASLSAYEIVLLFYNCLHDYGKTHFKPLVTEFSMLKNLDDSLLIDPSHYDEFDDLAYASSSERETLGL
jgi:ABC-type multidrug transport system fused ATPase/permease subunit